jgi:hypothetical protein
MSQSMAQNPDRLPEEWAMPEALRIVELPLGILFNLTPTWAMAMTLGLIERSIIRTYHLSQTRICRPRT